MNKIMKIWQTPIENQKENVDMLMRTNEITQPYGLTLTREMALALLEDRNEILEKYGRIEIDCSIMEKIIRQFCDSPHIQQEDYEEVIETLVEIFHYMKSELEDSITDDDLIIFLKDSYDGICEGSLDLLGEREAYKFIEKYRRGHWYEV
ncbi:MAG: hypothetical protein JXO44_02085 [Clostridia bacterium]|nr:hypothetical protein [Clostridia bacterium]